jgi:hypothetical protein
MRDQARSIARFAAIAVALYAATACTSTRAPVTVVHDQRDDLSQFRTWDWIEGHALVVRAPSHDAAALEAELANLLENELREHGLERAPGAGELRVGAVLVARRSMQAFRRPNAVQTLTSFHENLYEVQSEVTDMRPVDRFRLSLYVTGPEQERLLWQADLTDQKLDGLGPHLAEAVTDALASFPPRAPAATD